MTHKEYPILYSTPMIQAILDGRKSQTRRIIKGDFYVENDPTLTAYIPDYITGEPQPVKLPCPYGKVGDFTWARETFAEITGILDPGIDAIIDGYFYKASYQGLGE